MATLSLLQAISLAVTGEAQKLVGDTQTPQTATVNGIVYDLTFSLAAGFTAATLWETPDGQLTSFSYIVVLSDAEIVLELANTTPSPDARALFRLAANCVMVIPTGTLGAYSSDTSRLDGSALVLDTDYGTIKQIRAQRDVAGGGVAANIRLMLIA